MKVVWTRLALADLGSAYGYIAAESPGSAIHVIERVQQAVASLGSHPELGRLGRVNGTRELIVPGTPFIVAYRLKTRRVELLAVVHSARLWPDQFEH